MGKEYYLKLAREGLCMPIGADLILHQHPNSADILSNGKKLGKVLEETAMRFGTPLAVPHMNLELEKTTLLAILDVSPDEIAQYHFDTAPDMHTFIRVSTALLMHPSQRVQAQLDAIRYIVQETDLLPIGMSIGPFSLMTKLVADPITPVCMAGMGMSAAEEPEIGLIESVMELGMQVIMHNISAQIEAGAKAIFIAEPAANIVYFSPNQIDEGSDIFEKFAMKYNRRIKQLLDNRQVDLIFHCCGELTPYMVGKFAELDPVILSLGSSGNLWEDAALVPKDIVLYGNLPSKRFYSDELITLEGVAKQGAELVEKMREVGHPFILGTECDVLSVPGAHDTILQKVDTISGCCEAAGTMAEPRRIN